MFKRTRREDILPTPTAAPAKVPFHFVNLGLNELDPDEIFETNSSFTYIQGTTVPSTIAPLDNVYDPLIEHDNLIGQYLENTHNTNRYEYIANNRQKANGLIQRAMSSISQNIIIIFNNGFGRFIDPFIIEPNERLGSREVLNFESCCYWDDIYKERTENNVYGGAGFRGLESQPATSGDEVVLNCLDAIDRIVERTSKKYDTAIRYYTTGNRLDIKAFAKYILDSDDIDFNDIDETQYMGIVVGALNQVAVDDIRKIKEIAEIEIFQANSQYFRTNNDPDKYTTFEK